MQLLKAGLQYFLIVFGTGFVLGPIRILWLVPRLGTRLAELLELPVMVLVSVVAANWVIRHNQLPQRWQVRTTVGVSALAMVIAAELGVGVWLAGIGPREYIASRDPVAGPAYYATLLLFAAMPVLVRR